MRKSSVKGCKIKQKWLQEPVPVEGTHSRADEKIVVIEQSFLIVALKQSFQAEPIVLYSTGPINNSNQTPPPG